MKCIILSILLLSPCLVSAQDEILDDVQKILTDLKDTSLAIQVLRAAVSEDNSNWTYLYNLGLLYHQTGRSAQALPYFEQAIRLDSIRVQPMYYIGNYYFEKGDMERATRFYSLYLSGDVDNREIRYKRAEAWMSLKDYYSAISDWSYLIDLEQSADLFFNRGLSRLALNDLEGSALDFEKVIALDEEYINAYYYLGLSYYQSYLYKKAENQWKQVLKIDDEITNAHYQLAILYLKKKKKSKACVHLLRAYEQGWQPADDTETELLEYCKGK